MKQIKSVFVFENGGVMVFDQGGLQIAELQNNLYCDWAKKAEAAGYEVDGLVIEGMNGTRWRFFKVEGGYNLGRV